MTSTPPGTITAGQTFNVTVKLEDSFSNVATNYSGTVTAALVADRAAAPSEATPASLFRQRPPIRAMRRLRACG